MDSETKTPTAAASGFAFDNSYARLPDRFFQRVAPTPVAAPRLITVNEALARTLGLNPKYLASREGVEMLSGNRVPQGAEPIALAYAGHQFGRFVPQLGDGRAVLLGESVGGDGSRRDIQLKGSGQTQFSRRGDGRAALGPVLREYVVSEAMAALGIPTTRALAALTTGERVQRETVLPGALIVRVAASHLRIGTFQYFAARKDVDGLRRLTDTAIARHYPDAAGEEKPARALLDRVIARQAFTVARWMHVGFIHGVMNTDNMTISGETIDYGPCAFMDDYHPARVYSSIDGGGRYAFGNQPGIAQWNLARLAEALLPLLSDKEEDAIAQAQEALTHFVTGFESHYDAGMAKKLGILHPREDDARLAQDLLDRMAYNKADYTLTFRTLSDAAKSGDDGSVRSHFKDPAAFDEWALNWRERLNEDGGDAEERLAMMRSVNPAFIPRNHRVEEMIAAATGGDFAPFETLNAVLSRPYDDQPENSRYATPPREDEIVRETFCGT